MKSRTVKACPKCREWIDKGATKCPHCRSQQPAQNWGTAVAIVILVALGVWSYRSWYDSPKPRHAAVKRGAEQARVATERKAAEANPTAKAKPKQEAEVRERERAKREAEHARVAAEANAEQEAQVRELERAQRLAGYVLRSVAVVGRPTACFVNEESGKKLNAYVGDTIGTCQITVIDFPTKRVLLKEVASGETLTLELQQTTATGKRAKSPGPAVPSDVSYSIIDSSVVPRLKRSVDVRLNKKVSEETLKAIALELKAQDPQQYKRTFIAYYLREMPVGHGVWATTHFDPDLEVRILGLTAEDEDKLISEETSGTRKIVGRWLDERPYMGSRIMIFWEHGKLFIEWAFPDGSTLKRKLVERESSRASRRFDPLKGEGLLGSGGSTFGEHLVLGPDGNLQIRDNDGLIAIALKID